MTDEQFASGVDEIIATHTPGHAAHRALDVLWTRYTQELPEGHPVRTATAKWMRAIEGDHSEAKPYPLGSMPWLKRPLACKFGRHGWAYSETVWGCIWSANCRRCGATTGSGNPCP